MVKGDIRHSEHGNHFQMSISMDGWEITVPPWLNQFKLRLYHCQHLYSDFVHYRVRCSTSLCYGLWTNHSYIIALNQRPGKFTLIPIHKAQCWLTYIKQWILKFWNFTCESGNTFMYYSESGILHLVTGESGAKSCMQWQMSQTPPVSCKTYLHEMTRRVRVNSSIILKVHAVTGEPESSMQCRWVGHHAVTGELFTIQWQMSQRDNALSVDSDTSMQTSCSVKWVTKLHAVSDESDIRALLG